MATDEKNFNDIDDNRSSQTVYSSIPQEQEQSAQTSISVGSFPHEQKSTSSEDILGRQNFILDEPKEDDSSLQGSRKSFTGENGQISRSSEDRSLRQISVTSDKHEHRLPDPNGTPDLNHPTDSFSSSSINVPCSPVLSEKSASKLSVTPNASPLPALTSWLSITGSYMDAKAQSTPSIVSSMSVNELDASPDLRTGLQVSSSTSVIFPITPDLLLEIDDSGYGGGPSSAGATAVLDFIAEILADIVSEQLKATQTVESILETVPLYVDSDSTLVFQGLCLSRLMNFLERHLLRDDEEDEKKLDKNRWSLNLESLCWMIVDRVYMGSFPQPVGVLRTLEFLLSMLQLANKDGRIEEAAPCGKGLLSITRGSRQLESYIQAILKNTNRMIMHCFLPSFLISIGEDDFVSSLGFQIEGGKGSVSKVSQDESAIDICTVLQLLVGNKRLILCPSNMDADFVCCLCINLISLLSDNRQNVQSLAVDVMKYLLLHRRPALEDLLVSKPNQGPSLDVLHGGFDKLLTGSSSAFFEWFQKSEPNINKVLEQCASIMWVQYVGGSAKFPGVRIKGMEVRRKREMGRKFRDTSKLDLKHREQLNERRYALELVRDMLSTELRVIRQDKYGWVLHAESEWQTHIQQLIHERGIFPFRKSPMEVEWQHCPIEGPYRMRKKLERCKLTVDTIHNVLDGGSKIGDTKLANEGFENALDASGSDSDSYFNILYEGTNGRTFDGKDYPASSFKDDDGFKLESSGSAQFGWNDDHCSSVNEPSLHSAQDFGAKSSLYSVPMTESIHAKSDLASPRQSSSMRVEDMRYSDDKSEKELHDNGEYLIRPFLEPSEKIRFKYNCERVVGLDKHDGIFLIGDLCLYVIENFYINDSGCICEKENEDELSVIDQALGVKKDFSSSAEFQMKSPSSLGMIAKSLAGGRAWAYNGGAWGKEKVCSSGNLPHPWHMWKLDSIHELLKRDYQLRPVAVEIFSMDGCNDLLVFHKKEREEVFKNLVAMNLPRNSMYVFRHIFIFSNILVHKILDLPLFKMGFGCCSFRHYFNFRH